MAEDNGNGLEVKGFGTEVKAGGGTAYPVLLLLSFAITTVSIMYMIQTASGKIEEAIRASNTAAIAAVVSAKEAQEALRIETTKEHNKLVYNYQVDMCIRHIERTRTPDFQKWLWERWSNLEQVKVYCPWLTTTNVN